MTIRRSWRGRHKQNLNDQQGNEDRVERHDISKEDIAAEYRRRQFEIVVEEWRARTEAIRHRQDLEQKNMNVAIVLVASVTSFLLAYVSQNSVDALFEREIALLIPVVSTVLSSFQLRQLDHEVNIADYGAYVRHVVGPSLKALAREDLARYEKYIDDARNKRTRGLLGVLAFGNETFQLLFLSFVTAILSVAVLLARGDSTGGTAHWLFVGLAAASMALSVLCAWQTVAMLQHYKTVNQAAENWARPTACETLAYAAGE